jgi:outer membrane protein, heavy metal efflux system
MRAIIATAAAALLLVAAIRVEAAASSEAGLTVDQLIEVALEANPQIKSARARWKSAEHSIRQNYAPADPIFTFMNVDSARNPFQQASEHTLQVTESFQFPGKALLQANSARRAAEIARLAYVTTLRDLRARTQAAFYQDLLDAALADVTAERVADLGRVLQVTQVAYSTSRVTQEDFISAEFDLAAARQQEDQSRVAEQNDGTLLNQLLYRSPDEPLPLDRRIELKPIDTPLEALSQRAIEVRQEIMQAALGEANSAIALQLAKLEYAPDYQVGYAFDDYLVTSGAPASQRIEDHSVMIGFNLPIFFWLHQREDVTKAGYDLDAARYDLSGLKSQTAATVTALYRSAQLAYRSAILYRDTLIPLAHQDFEVALVAYSSGKVDFTTLTASILRSYDARSAYLQGANQFLAAKVALEQEIGEPIPK